MTIEEILAEMAHIHLESPPDDFPRTCLICNVKNVIARINRSVSGLPTIEMFTWRLIHIGLWHRTVHCRICGHVYDVEWIRQ